MLESGPGGARFDSGHGRKLFFIVFVWGFLHMLAYVWDICSDIFGDVWGMFLDMFRTFSDMFGTCFRILFGHFRTCLVLPGIFSEIPPSYRP